MIPSKLFIPFSFAAVMVLLMLFTGSLRQSGGEGRNIPFLALILLAAAQSVLPGLRWGYGITAIMHVLPVTAAQVPPLAYCGVARLVHRSTLSLVQRLALHSAPAVLVALVLAVLPMAIDVSLISIFLGYAAAILRLIRQGTDALRLAAFEDASRAHKAILFAAAGLILSALVDIYLALDFVWLDGWHALGVITGGNIGVPASLTVRFPARSIAAQARTSRNMSTSSASQRPASFSKARTSR